MLVNKTGWTIKEICELTFDQIECLFNAWSGKKGKKDFKPSSKDQIKAFVSKLKGVQ